MLLLVEDTPTPNKKKERREQEQELILRKERIKKNIKDPAGFEKELSLKDRWFKV